MSPDERNRWSIDDGPELPFCVDCHAPIVAGQRSVPADGRDAAAGLVHLACLWGRQSRPFRIAS